MRRKPGCEVEMRARMLDHLISIGFLFLVHVRIRIIVHNYCAWLLVVLLSLGRKELGCGFLKRQLGVLDQVVFVAIGHPVNDVHMCPGC